MTIHIKTSLTIIPLNNKNIPHDLSFLRKGRTPCGTKVTLNPGYIFLATGD